jgi:hypothetical protein
MTWLRFRRLGRLEKVLENSKMVRQKFSTCSSLGKSNRIGSEANFFGATLEVLCQM